MSKTKERPREIKCHSCTYLARNMMNGMPVCGMGCYDIFDSREADDCPDYERYEGWD